MPSISRYPFARSTQKLCGVLKISPERVLRRAGLPADGLAHEGRGATAHEVFDIWNAVVAEARRPDFALHLGRTFAHGPFMPAVFAFSCSPTIEIGLKRLAVFKPLVGPFRLEAVRIDDALSISIDSTEEDVPLPESLAVYEAVYFLELARTFTAEPIVPLSVGFPGVSDAKGELTTFFGVAPVPAPRAELLLSLDDATRPLITENEEMWTVFEKDLRRQLLDRDRSQPMHARVRAALLELLPAGQSSADAVCARLHIGKRSLYRHLAKEGHSYQALLDATRTELSLHYLRNDEISVQEISYLLAFNDPNSFYRAFRGWTGMTPTEARAQSTH